MSRRGRRAFTLVELLVVIGVIAVLVALLLPALARARGQALQVACASNLRQLAMAFRMYANDNHGRYPSDGSGSAQAPTDWIHWHAGRDLRESAIARYLNGFEPSLARCPADDYDTRRPPVGNPWVEQYHYSYSMNHSLHGFSSGAYRVGVPHADRVRNASEKLLLFDEDEATVDDGSFITYIGPYGYYENTLANRHDPQRHKGWRDWPDSVRQNLATRPDRFDRGNAAFVDGHVDYVTRQYTWEFAHLDPAS